MCGCAVPMKRIFVTGWGGFVGTYLGNYLAQRGHQVLAVTRLKNIAMQQSLHGLIELFNVDINDLSQLPKGIDLVIHIAASLPHDGQKNTNYIRDNILATEKLIQLALRSQIRKFIYFSTVSVCGNIQGPVIDEKTPIINPDAYGLSKLFGEYNLMELSDQLPSLTLRLPAIVGYGAKGHWLATVIDKALKNKKIHIFNASSLFNNAVHIQDLCFFIETLFSQSFLGAQCITLASEGGLTIKSIAEKIKKLTHSSSEIIEVQNKQTPFKISIEKAKSHFNFIPRDFASTLELYLNDL